MVDPMTRSFFDEFPDPREELCSGPGEPPTAPLELGAVPFTRTPLAADPFVDAAFGADPFVGRARRRDRARPRRVLVTVGSLTAGAVAAAGAAFVLTGGTAPRLAFASSGGGTASGSATQQDDAGGARTADAADARAADDASRYRGRGDLCVRLDAKALAAVDAARTAGGAGPSVRVRTDKGDVVLPMSAVKVVSCTWPTPKGSPSASAAAKRSPGAKPAKPSATTSSRTSRPSGSSSAPAPKPKPSTSSAAPKPKPKPTTTSTKPAPKPTTTAPAPKPTTSSGS